MREITKLLSSHLLTTINILEKYHCINDSQYNSNIHQCITTTFFGERKPLE